MLVYLKYREDNHSGMYSDWDFELIDLHETLDDIGPMDDDWSHVTEELVDKALKWWLDNHYASVWGDKWMGANWEYVLVDKPPEDWFIKKWRRAMEQRMSATRDEDEAAQNLYDHYPPRR